MITALLKFIRALRFSSQGLRAAYRGELAFRWECWATLVVIPLACYLGNSRLEIVVLIATWLLVLVVELLNSAIETVVNRVSLAQHPLSGQAKDMGSAAVLVTLIIATLSWVLLLL